jgi:adenylylsulfate kinase-like enzyme
MKAAGLRLPSSLLIITGSMGSGKSAVMAEASDILRMRGVQHAAVDLDVLGLAHLPDATPSDEVMYRNLRAVVQNYVTAGADRLLLTRAIETRAELEPCISSVGAKEVIVCRLKASIQKMQQRVGSRELGIARDKYIERVVTLNESLEHAGLENFVAWNEDRPITDVANEVLERAGWS